MILKSFNIYDRNFDHFRRSDQLIVFTHNTGILNNVFELFSYEYTKTYYKQRSIENGAFLRYCGLIIEQLISSNEINCRILRST